MATELEIAAMCRAIAISALGLGTTSPNPAVGCVILDSEGRAVGDGYHHRKGEAHAEVNALAAAGSNAKGGVAVLTLEPCNHHGITPPCHQALLDAGIKRVIVATLDPTSRGEGGVARLRAAGVTVEVGVMEDEALLVLGPWSESLRTGRPVVTWLYALSAEGDPIPVDADASRSAVANADTIALAVDIVIHDGGAIVEGIPGGHVWTPPDLRFDNKNEGVEVLKRVSALGARTVLLNGGSALAGPFLAAGLVEEDRLLRTVPIAVFDAIRNGAGPDHPDRLPAARGHSIGWLGADQSRQRLIAERENMLASESGRRRPDHATSTLAVVDVGGGTGSPWARNDSTWSLIASAMWDRTSRSVGPVATQPGRSGTYAEKFPSACSITTA
jgi:diaminohydroxyphosphoribosylaminopyrimidine deaminase/5-amino-6-(5-phosphoribosylamino)uracil reductase